MYQKVAQLINKFAIEVSWQRGDYQKVLQEAGFFGPDGRPPEGRIADKIYECLDKAAAPDQFEGGINASILIGPKLTVKINTEGHKLAPKVTALLNAYFAGAIQGILQKNKAPAPAEMMILPWLVNFGYK